MLNYCGCYQPCGWDKCCCQTAGLAVLAFLFHQFLADKPHSGQKFSLGCIFCVVLFCVLKQTFSPDGEFLSNKGETKPTGEKQKSSRSWFLNQTLGQVWVQVPGTGPESSCVIFDPGCRTLLTFVCPQLHQLWPFVFIKVHQKPDPGSDRVQLRSDSKT